MSGIRGYLGGRAQRALDEAQKITKDSDAEVTSEALCAYAFIQKALANGSELLIRTSPDAEPQIVHIV